MKSIAACACFTRARALKRLKTKLLNALNACKGSASVAACALLGACAGMGGGAAPAHYRCAPGTELSVRFVDDTAVLSGSRGNEVLYRDAGGQGPGQAFYSNPQLRAEFGVGPSGQDAVLRYAGQAQVLRCVRG